MTDTHEVVRKRHVRSSSHSDNDEDEAGEDGWIEFDVGDTITPTESELASFPNRFRELRGPVSDNGSEEPEGNEEPPLELTEMTVAEVQEALETGDYDDSLDTLEEYETQNDDRKGVKQSIDDRR